jgi:hypothetical protein
MAQRTLSKAGHKHPTGDVTGLQSALDGKAAAAHTHPISDVTNLQAQLDGKAATGHTHAQLHDRTHSITATQDHVFPGGTTTFLRADGTFATPTGTDGNATSLQGRPLLATQPTTGQVVKWNGSAWAPAADVAGEGGGVTQGQVDTSIATHNTTSTSHADKVTTVGSPSARITNANTARPTGVTRCIWFVAPGVVPINLAAGDEVDDPTEIFYDPAAFAALQNSVADITQEVELIKTTRLKDWVGTLSQYNALPTPRPTDTVFHILQG